MLSSSEKTAKMNRFRREAELHQIGSPYRVSEYIGYRMKGMSPEAALAKTKEGPKQCT